MFIKLRPYLRRIRAVPVLLATAVFLTSCGPERIAQEKTLLETGEFFSSAQSEEITEHDEKFDAFCERVFRDEMAGSGTLDLHYTLLHPENYGISQEEVSLSTYALADMIKNNSEIRKLKDELADFDRSRLSDEQKLLYDTLSETLDTSLMREGLELYEQPLAPTIGIQAQLPILLAEYSFRSPDDVEDYLALLSQTDDYYKEILEFESQKADAGLAPSDASIENILESCKSYLIDPEDNFLLETFKSRLSALEKIQPITNEQKDDFLSRHTAAIRDHFIPAYQNLIAGMEALKGRGIRDGGLAELKDGKRYYEYLLRSGPGISRPVAELARMLSSQIEDDLSAISLLCAKDPDFDPQKESFSLTDPVQILEDLQKNMLAEFPSLPDCGYEIRYVPEYLEQSLSPAFYLTAPLDDTDQNVIYINNGYSDSTDSLYTTLAHEGFPGHLYQTVYSRTHESSPLLSILSCSGANEGWATYVETLAGTFDNGLSKACGEYLSRLRSLSLCVHGLLDIGINYEGWSKEQAGDFIKQYFQADPETVDELWQVMIDNPTNYLEYCGGYVEFMGMRKEAEKTLGPRFSPLEFHRFVLDTGPVPFSVMRRYFSQWLSKNTS